MKIFKKINIYIWSIILIIIDQITKIYVINNFKNAPITIIKGVLRITYCENNGVAFSMGSGKIIMFIILNIILILGLIYFYEKNKCNFNKINKIFIVMIISGGISNLLDRIIRGYVVDFIDVNQLFSFAIFNIADIFIVIGVIGFGILSLYETGKEKSNV